MNERRQQLGEQAHGGSPLLERERELADLEALALATVAGHGSTVVIEGQPGLGKSRLLDQAATSAAGPESALILRFTCGELEQELAWSAVVGLLGGAIAEPVQAVLSNDADGFSVIHGLYLLVAELALGRPLLLLLDDAQWSDPESLHFLVYLQRRLADLPVGLVVATRPQAAADQRELLDRINGGPNARTHRLSGLSVDAVTALLRSGPFPTAPEDLCRACWALTAGNPFYLHEFLLGLGEDRVGTAPSAEELPQILPGSVSRSILLRLGRLPVANASAFARAVAVLGDGTTLRHAAVLSGISGDQAAEVADALAASELLAPGEPLRFVHPLVRSAIYADIPAGRRARLHRAAAAVLSAEGAAPEVVATHLLHVPLEASAETVAGLCAAAVAARKHGAPHAAVRYLRRALQEPPREGARGELLADLAHAEAAIGDPRAVGHLEEALGRVAPARRPEILLALGWAEHHAGRFAAAADAFQRGLNEVREDQSELAAELEAGYLGSATLDSARAADAVARIKLIEAAPAERQGSAHRSLLAQVLFARTTSGAPYRETIELAQRIWAGGALLDQEGADSQTVWHVIGSLSWADAYAEAIAVTDAVLRAADARGSVQAHARGRYARAWPNYWTGRLTQAADDARAAVDIWYGGLETYLPAAIYWLVLAELERDDLGAAERALALAAPVARWEGTGMAVFVAAAEGHLAAHRGQADVALSRHLRCGELAQEIQLTNPSVMPWRSQAALSAALTGERELARQLALDELSLARATGTPRAIGVALRTAGMVSDASVGPRLLAESVAVLEDSGATLEYARACVELGAAIRRSGQRRAARPTLERGLELARAAGASSLAARAQTEISAAGGRSARPAVSGPAALTASERRIADLAAEGHTNRYIANLLQVSVKAVEWHLHQCYRKLDIKTRRQLAGVLES